MAMASKLLKDCPGLLSAPAKTNGLVHLKTPPNEKEIHLNQTFIFGFPCFVFFGGEKPLREQKERQKNFEIRTTEAEMLQPRCITTIVDSASVLQTESESPTSSFH